MNNNLQVLLKNVHILNAIDSLKVSFPSDRKPLLRGSFVRDGPLFFIRGGVPFL